MRWCVVHAVHVLASHTLLHGLILYTHSTYTVLTSNHSDSTALRRILEDYLEVDSSRSPRLQQLLRSELLSRFFRRVCVSAQEVLFDVDQLADKVMAMTTLFCGTWIGFARYSCSIADLCCDVHVGWVMNCARCICSAVVILLRVMCV